MNYIIYNILISLQNINETHSMKLFVYCVKLRIYCMKLRVYCHGFLSPCKHSEKASFCFVEFNKKYIFDVA